MAVPESELGRARRLASWLAPTAVAASAGAIAGGAVEAAGFSGLLGFATCAGFFGLLALPLLFAVGALARAVHHAWRPGELVAPMIEEGGGAPRFAAWVAYLWLATFALAWMMFQGTWLFAAWTAFKANTLSFLEPMLAMGTALVLVALSRPFVTLYAALLRAIDRRWRARGHRTLLRPRVTLAWVVGATLALGAVLWFFAIKKRIGPFDLGVFMAPCVAIVTCIAMHLAWSRLGRARLAVGGLAGLVATASLVLAIVATRREASLTLEIWSARPVAGLAIDKLFDLDRIRANISLAQFRPVERPGAVHRDIVLVTIDTVRADHTPPYGGTAEMPTLGDLGMRGTTFAWAFSPSNVTRRSVPSMVTGLAPNRVRGRVVGWALRVDPRHVLLAERLRAGGYETVGFMCCGGFWGAKARTGLGRGLEHLIIDQNGRGLARSARAWLDAREKSGPRRPLFVWMHILEPHNWNQGQSEPRNEEERARFYDRSLAAADALAGEMLGGFANRPPDRRPIEIITADHGEGLGEHGQPFHSTDLYNSQIHVPFVVAGPGIPVARVVETVSLTDLTPTIIDLAGFQPPAGNTIDGRSIADLVMGTRSGLAEGGLAFAAMIKDRSNPGGVTAIVRGGWKLIDTGVGLELYDLRIDPGERTNLVGQQAKIVADLRQILTQRQAMGALAPFGD